MSRPGLYLLVIIATMSSCGTRDATRRIEQRLDAMQTCVMEAPAKSEEDTE